MEGLSMYRNRKWRLGFEVATNFARKEAVTDKRTACFFFTKQDTLATYIQIDRDDQN